MNRPKIYATPRHWLLTALTVFVGVFTAVTINILYTNRIDQESNQAWCDIINGLVNRNSVIENPDKDTLEFRRQLAVLKDKYKC